jgi:hypothetical protein
MEKQPDGTEQNATATTFFTPLSMTDFTNALWRCRERSKNVIMWRWRKAECSVHSRRVPNAT